MKPCYEEERNNGSSNMFAKLHEHQQKPQYPYSYYNLQVSRKFQTSEEDEIRSRGQSGATIEVVKRPRGRPHGAKNKPKPPVIITRDTECAMHSHVLEVPAGLDVVDSIAQFARRRNIGLCVLTGSGTVANVTLRQPCTAPGATVTFHGRFDILSLSATFFPQSSIPSSASGFTISLVSPHGQILGGSVSGSLVAAGTVVIIAASITNPLYHRLPEEDEVPNSASGEACYSPPAASEGDHLRPPDNHHLHSTEIGYLILDNASNTLF